MAVKVVGKEEATQVCSGGRGLEQYRLGNDEDLKQYRYWKGSKYSEEYVVGMKGVDKKESQKAFSDLRMAIKLNLKY